MNVLMHQDPEIFESINMEFSNPIESVTDEIMADLAAIRSVVINRPSPRRGIAVCEVGPKIAEIVSFRSEMVVDDIKDDSEVARMAGVHEPFEPLGPTVAGVGRKWIDSVVPPVTCSGKLRFNSNNPRKVGPWFLAPSKLWQAMQPYVV